MSRGAAGLVAMVLVLAATAGRAQGPAIRLMRPIPTTEVQQSQTLFRGVAPESAEPPEKVFAPPEAAPAGQGCDLSKKTDSASPVSLWHRAAEESSFTSPPKAPVSPTPSIWSSPRDLPRAKVDLPRARVDLPHARVDLPRARVESPWVTAEPLSAPQPAPSPITVVSATAWQPAPPEPAPSRPNPVPPAPPPEPKPTAAPTLFPPLPQEEAKAYRPEFYGAAEYLLWWTRGSQLPPLVTTGHAQPLPPTPAGLAFGAGLASPGTSVLIGDQSVSGNARSGARLMVGAWLLEDRLLGVELQGFFLGQSNQQFSVTSLGDLLLARPVRDAADGLREVGIALVLPPHYAGVEKVNVSSGFWGLAADARCSLAYNTWYHFDARLGYRTLGLNEDVTITDLAFAGVPPTNTGLPLLRAGSDRFAVQNQFHGARLGLDGGLSLGAWTIDLRGSLALGCNVQSVDVSGLTVLTTSTGATQAFPAGVLATTSNSGNHSRAVFSVVPEVGLRLGYQLTERVRAYVGYDLIYWSDVLRPGNQIDRTVNLSQVPQPTPPGTFKPTSATGAFPFAGSDFWAQGLTLGLAFCY